MKLPSRLRDEGDSLPSGREQHGPGVLLFIVTPARYFFSHRLSLASAASAAGWQVHVAVPAGESAGGISMPQMTSHPVTLHRSIGSPIQEISSLLSLMGLCRRIRPDLIHAVSPKAAVFGGLAARALGIPAVIMKGGLGSTATQPGARNLIARSCIREGIRASIWKRATLVVQNGEEKADLARSNRVRARTVLVAGAGVNCTTFRPTPEPPNPVTVVLPARMLKSKGVPELAAAARILAARGVHARFLLAGDLDVGNSSAVQLSEIREWEREGIIQWLGHCADMPSVLSLSHIVCLPSHGEGLPKALTEAAAAGRPIVATDVAGCRDVVQPGINGLLVPPRDPRSLADALQKLILDPGMRRRFGQAGRAIALESFDEEIIIPRMLSLYNSLRTAES